MNGKRRWQNYISQLNVAQVQLQREKDRVSSLNIVDCADRSRVLDAPEYSRRGSDRPKLARRSSTEPANEHLTKFKCGFGIFGIVLGAVLFKIVGLRMLSERNFRALSSSDTTSSADDPRERQEIVGNFRHDSS